MNYVKYCVAFVDKLWKNVPTGSFLAQSDINFEWKNGYDLFELL